MKDKRITFLLVLALIIASETSFITAKSLKGIMAKSHGCSFHNQDVQKKLAEEYLNQNLYEHAIRAYEDYLNSFRISSEKKSNVSYIIGNIYMDDLRDYTNAVASFVRAKVLYPANPNISEVNKKIVACLEMLGRPIDAERELVKATAIESQEAGGAETKDNEIIVAKIGDRNISMAELNREIEGLPPFIKDNYKDKPKKLDFLQQYITEELLFDSAKRRGLDNDKAVMDSLYRMKKRMMADKLIEQDVDLKIAEPSEGDIGLYYDGHKDKYMEEKKDESGNVSKRQKELAEVKDQVKSDYISDKRQEMIRDLINNLAKAKDIKIYEDNFKEKE